ncbi:MAG: hypothetical protein ACKO24_07675, partial [Leptolyngbyaceae cyanobacterium]
HPSQAVTSRPMGTPLKRSHPALRAPLSSGHTQPYGHPSQEGMVGGKFLCEKRVEGRPQRHLAPSQHLPKNIPSWEG